MDHAAPSAYPRATVQNLELLGCRQPLSSAIQIQTDRARSNLSVQPCRLELTADLAPMPEGDALVAWLIARGWTWPTDEIPASRPDHDLLTIAVLGLYLRKN